MSKLKVCCPEEEKGKAALGEGRKACGALKLSECCLVEVCCSKDSPCPSAPACASVPSAK